MPTEQAPPPVARPQTAATRTIRVPVERPCLEVRLRLEAGGPILGSEPVRSADLADVLHESLRENVFRRGQLVGTPEGIPTSLILLLDEAPSTRCRGYAVEMEAPDGPVHSTVFSFQSLEDVAHRGITRLKPADGESAANRYLFDLHHSPSAGTGPERPEAENLLGNATVTRPPLPYLSIPLAPLLARARSPEPFPVLPAVSSPFPVFYTESVFREVEDFARKGAGINPRFESGAVLAGSLCSCPDSGEFFVVVLAAFEVRDADQSLYALSYTGESWSRIQRLLRARQNAQPFLRMVGQAHGHNYLPNEGQTCEACATLDHCNLTNLFASRDDQTWSRAVFSQQPWHLCHIFGLTARGDLIDGLFSQHDGRLSHRAYHLLPDFNPDLFEIRSAPPVLSAASANPHA